MKYLAGLLIALAVLAGCKKDDPEYVMVNGTLHLDSIATAGNMACTAIRGSDASGNGSTPGSEFRTDKDGNFTIRMSKAPTGPVTIIMAFHKRHTTFTLPGDVATYNAGKLYMR